MRWSPLTLLVVALCIGVSHKLQATISLTFIITSLICRVMLRTLGVAVLLSLPCLLIIRLGSLVLSELVYLTRVAISWFMSLQSRLSRPNFIFSGVNRQFFSNIKTAEPASILSDECIMALTRRTQWVVDSPSSYLQLVKSTIDKGCLHVSLKF